MVIQRGAVLRGESARRAQVGAARAAQANDSCVQCKLAIGQCSCNGGGRVMALAAAPATTVADPRFPGVIVPGGAVNSGVVVAQPNGGVAVPDNAGGWVVVPTPSPGCYPRRLCDNGGQPIFWSRAMREVMAMGKPEPYVDPLVDFVSMDAIYSDITTIAPGTTTNVNVSPEVGTFAAFYYRIVLVDEATQVRQVDWRVTRPSVIGCPTPCANPGPILSQFVDASPEQCCGTPLAAFLDERSRNVPLVTPITNNQAAGNLLAQIEVRGYCCSDRIC